ncbi:hypothetical protein [Leptothoe kymatousa]|nr:hypothetical protein [Leptothoe kymatousa]
MFSRPTIELLSLFQETIFWRKAKVNPSDRNHKNLVVEVAIA